MCLFSISLVAAAIAVPFGASAQSRNAQIAVRAQVVADCQITAQDLAFGNYDAAVAATASTTVSIRCTPGAGATISFDGGGSGNPQAREMSGPANTNIRYFSMPPSRIRSTPPARLGN